MGWASERLDALKAGTMEPMPVAKTLQLGGLDDWGPGWAREVWKPKADQCARRGTIPTVHQRRGALS
jgi:hypothetical protein